jgi:hypothetical protein
MRVGTRLIPESKRARKQATNGISIIDSPESYQRYIWYVNPEGIQSSSPGLAFFQPNLGNGRSNRSNPKGVVSATVQAKFKTDTTLSGLRI